MRLSWIAAAGCAAALAFASAAEAAIMLATVRGTVTAGDDVGGDFGAPGSLAGRTFTLVFEYDSERGTNHTSNASYENRFGGSYEGPDSVGPVLSVFLTIGDVTRQLGVGAYSVATANASGQFAVESYERGRWDGSESLQSGDYATAITLGGVISPDLAAPFSSNQMCTGCGLFWLTDDSGIRTSEGRFRVTRFEVALAPVPEPSAWALMIAGFGAAGALLRHRRAAAA